MPKVRNCGHDRLTSQSWMNLIIQLALSSIIWHGMDVISWHTLPAPEHVLIQYSNLLTIMYSFDFKIHIVNIPFSWFRVPEKTVSNCGPWTSLSSICVALASTMFQSNLNQYVEIQRFHIKHRIVSWKKIRRSGNTSSTSFFHVNILLEWASSHLLQLGPDSPCS